MTQFLYSRCCQSLGVAQKESGVNPTSDSKGAATGGGLINYILWRKRFVS